MITRVTRGQQITVPARIRKALGIAVGSPVELTVNDDSLIVRPLQDDMEELFRHALRTKGKKHLTAKQMDELVEQRG